MKALFLQSLPLLLVLLTTCWVAMKLPTVENYRARMIEGAILSALMLARWSLDRFVFTSVDFEHEASLVLFAYAILRVLRSPEELYLLPCAAVAVAALVAKGGWLGPGSCLTPLLFASLRLSPRWASLLFVCFLLPAAFVVAN